MLLFIDVLTKSLKTKNLNLNKKITVPYEVLDT